jgi:outer membrane protein OmpA-like peptidoglycan-associated protein
MRLEQAFGASAIMLAIAVCCTPVMAQDVSNAAPAQATPAADDEVIHLHMPVHHSVHHRPPQPATPASVDAIGAEPGATAEAPAAAPAETTISSTPKTKRVSNPAPAPAIPLSLGDEGSESPAPPPVAVPASPAPHTVKTASIPPREAAHAPLAATGDGRAALTKHGDVLFQKGVSDPSPAQFKGVKLLAGDLNSALEAGSSRIQLEAYGGAPGDKSSDARRLSLKRALAVRQLLIDNGVPSNRIDVRAMGGVDDKGAADRVDVFVRAG